MEGEVSIAYDKGADVMYLAFSNVKAEAEEIDEGVFARYDPETGELVGFTVVNFSKKFTEELKEITIPLGKTV